MATTAPKYFEMSRASSSGGTLASAIGGACSMRASVMGVGSMVTLLRQAGEPAPDPVVEDDRDEQQGADRDLVPVGVDVGEDDALAGHAECEGPEGRSRHGALATGQQ